MQAPETDDDDVLEPCELCGKEAGAKLTLEAFLDFSEHRGGLVAASEEWPELFELCVCEPCARKPSIVRTLLRLAADSTDDAAHEAELEKNGALEAAWQPTEIAALRQGAAIAGVELTALERAPYASKLEPLVLQCPHVHALTFHRANNSANTMRYIACASCEEKLR